MARSKPERVYWDSCVFLALLKDEKTHGEQALRHMEEMYGECVAGKLEVVTSSLWRLEVMLDETSESHCALEEAFDSGTFLSAAGTEDVFKKALEIRRQIGKKTLLLADLIHVATAVTTGCSTLYSLDDDILKCSGRVSGLRIVKPESEPALFDE